MMLPASTAKPEKNCRARRRVRPQVLAKAAMLSRSKGQTWEEARHLCRATPLACAELNSLREGELAGEIDRVGLAAHIHLPAIAPTLATAAGLFFAAEGAADLRATRPGVYVGNSAVAPDRADEFFRLTHVVGEN